MNSWRQMAEPELQEEPGRRTLGEALLPDRFGRHARQRRQLPEAHGPVAGDDQCVRGVRIAVGKDGVLGVKGPAPDIRKQRDFLRYAMSGGYLVRG